MTAVARWVSLAALTGTIGPPVLLLAGRMELDQMKLAMLVAAIAWFGAAPLWMKRDAAR